MRSATKIRRFLLVWVAAVVAVLTTPQVSGFVMKVTFQELAQQSSIIVVGTVVGVFEVNGLRVGRIRADLVLKGTPKGDLLFLNQSTWMCDITGASVGERALWFLVPYEDTPEEDRASNADPDAIDTGDFYQPRGFRKAIDQLTPDQAFMAVSWAGRGQMGLREIHGVTYADVWTATVDLPPEVHSVSNSSEFSSVSSARLEDLMSVIVAGHGKARE